MVSVNVLVSSPSSSGTTSLLMKRYSRNVNDVDKLVQLLSRFLVARPKFGLQVERWLLDQSLTDLS